LFVNFNVQLIFTKVPHADIHDVIRRKTVFSKVLGSIKGVFGSSPAKEEVKVAMQISSPYNFKHIGHVRPDPHSSTGFSVRT
jgi:hypothetical protein